MVSVIISIMVDHSFDDQVDQTKACETDIFCIFYFFTEQAAFRIKSKNCYLIQDNVSGVMLHVYLWTVVSVS
jgi:hypothetical protein